jgi:hypothetical protein
MHEARVRRPASGTMARDGGERNGDRMTRCVDMARNAGRVRLALVVLLALIAGVDTYFYSDYRHFAEAPLPQLAESPAIDVPL